MGIGPVIKRPFKRLAQHIVERAFFGLEDPYRLVGLMRWLIGTRSRKYQDIRGYLDPACSAGGSTFAQYADKWHNPEARRRIEIRQDLVIDTVRQLGIDPRTWLEVGCGPAWNLQRLRHAHPAGRFLGVDLAWAQLANARRLRLDDGITLVQGDLHALPFADGAFDLVLTVMVIMHVAPARVTRALAELLRVSSRYVLHIEPSWVYQPDSLPGLALVDDTVFFHDLRKLYVKRFGCRIVAEIYQYRARGGGVDPILVLVERPSAQGSATNGHA